jgi:hypothetical protein
VQTTQLAGVRSASHQYSCVKEQLVNCTPSLQHGFLNTIYVLVLGYGQPEVLVCCKRVSVRHNRCTPKSYQGSASVPASFLQPFKRIFPPLRPLRLAGL